MYCQSAVTRTLTRNSGALVVDLNQVSIFNVDGLVVTVDEGAQSWLVCCDGIVTGIQIRARAADIAS
jgi:hypothetical protein